MKMALGGLNSLLPPQLRVSNRIRLETELGLIFLFGGDASPGEEELDEIVRRFEERGYILLWSTVLQDKVAFIKGESEKARVPKGFAIYTDDELQQLFAPDAPSLKRSTLRLIHEAKRQGAVVNSAAWRK